MSWVVSIVSGQRWVHQRYALIRWDRGEIIGYRLRMRRVISKMCTY